MGVMRALRPRADLGVPPFFPHSCELRTRLQAQEEEHQEAQKAKEADIEKLNQALCLRHKVKEGP